jgi:hypothetical protein
LQLFWTFKPGLVLAWGDVGFPEQFDLITARAGTDLNGYAASLPNPNRGVELRIAGNTGTTGGYSLLAGIGRNSQTGSPDVRSNIGDTRYARAAWKIGGNGLLSGAGGAYGVRAIGMDNSITFGLNYYNSGQGGSTNSEDGILGLSKTAYSGDIRAFFGPVRAVAQYARFKEVIDDTGVDFGKRTALSLEGDYWLYPWLFGVIRYEHLQDDLNGRINKIIPGIGVLLRPNVKIGLEYVSIKKDDIAAAAADAAAAGGILVPENTFNVYTQVGF